MKNKENFQDEIGDNHVATNAQNPVRKDAFDISDEEKIVSADLAGFAFALACTGKNSSGR